FEGGGQGLVRTVLRNRLLAWLGLISYGLYLWHGPIVLKLAQSSWLTTLFTGKLLALTLALLPITIACAAASYYFLDRPLLRYKRSRVVRDRPPQAAAQIQES